ncbi:hypothetical protein J3R83DRAFT_7465, partial [Lanmaoa asiatica]
VQFYVLWDSLPSKISTNLNCSMINLFSTLCHELAETRAFPAKVTSDDCAFYKLKIPVPFTPPKPEEGDAFIRQAKQKCEDPENRLRIEPTTTVRLLAGHFSSDHAYLVIKPPDPSLHFANVTENLRQNHTTLFERLRVKVKVLGSWALADVEENQKDGEFTEDIAELPPTFKDIQDALEMPRFYKESDVEGNEDYEVARKRYKTQFERVFRPIETESPALVKYREFAAFYNLLRGFNEDVVKIVGPDVSSAIKASNFAMHFVHPPFFSSSSRRFKYQQDTSWGFPIFVEATNPLNTFRKVVPRSDCMIISSQFQIPFVICEVISDKHERDRSRMLVQAVALARTGQFLLRPASTKKFFVVAIYVDADMVVSRYIVMETGDGDACNGRKPVSDHDCTGCVAEKSVQVSVHKKDFNLRRDDQQVDLLREMYNLVTQIDALSSELAPSKEGQLHDIQRAAKNVVSLTNKERTKTMSSISVTMHSITEES